MFTRTSLKKATLAAVIGSALGMSSLVNAATEIKAAFNQSNQHPQYVALQGVAEKLERKTEGRYKLSIFPNELLGDQRAALELVQMGSVQMAVVANPLVENYDKTFRVIGMPYIYTGPDHQEKVFTSGMLDELFASTNKFGFEVLTAYTAGARSMYTKKGPINTIEDMKGEKIRVMQSDTMIKMLSCMGGTGVAMGQGEVYSAIQQGVLDGAENNEITYADLKQYEVAPYFSSTRHLMVPDLVVMSTDFLASMPKADRDILVNLVKESTKIEFELWNKQISEAKAIAQSKGAKFNDVDIKPFQESCKSLQDSLIETPAQKELFKQITELK
ncbi:MULTISPECIES: TRAP transporter substrate-binding protein [Vibrio]|uniref:TRAP transporter substrate-binding protein n=1 Tax=Vibrio casei TaxID=673372 RepID=A0A368LJT2_9VIBR|nr:MULTISPECIES: TRAP transporter substrate-binding protein [Vibrio]RCS70603.1 TRAP transporter substrate-binding protein [Vibrio casei]SJN27310.1 TRAP-type C4-dicarboxylate transport system, periplasmic component [Vibrio casei]HBV77793.1 TRAP transporter substrate-binding protein [Vibrio sp.]